MPGLPDDTMVRIAFTFIDDYAAKKGKTVAAAPTPPPKEEKKKAAVKQDETLLGTVSAAFFSGINTVCTGVSAIKEQAHTSYDATRKVITGTPTGEDRIKKGDVYKHKLREALTVNTLERWLETLRYFSTETADLQKQQSSGTESDCAQTTAALASLIRSELRKNLPQLELPAQPAANHKHDMPVGAKDARPTPPLEAKIKAELKEHLSELQKQSSQRILDQIAQLETRMQRLVQSEEEKIMQQVRTLAQSAANDEQNLQKHAQQLSTASKATLLQFMQEQLSQQQRDLEQKVTEELQAQSESFQIQAQQCIQELSVTAEFKRMIDDNYIKWKTLESRISDIERNIHIAAAGEVQRLLDKMIPILLTLADYGDFDATRRAVAIQKEYKIEIFPQFHFFPETEARERKGNHNIPRWFNHNYHLLFHEDFRQDKQEKFENRALRSSVAGVEMKLPRAAIAAAAGVRRPAMAR